MYLRNKVGNTDQFNKNTFVLWKFQFLIQILREIKFGESSSANSAIFAILGAVNFILLVNFSLQKVKKGIKIRI